MRTYIPASIVAVVVLSADALSAPVYRITDLSSQIPFSVTELDLNNSGQLAGTALVGGGQTIAFRWSSAAGFSMLANLPSNVSNPGASAYGINNSGAIAGAGTNEMGLRAVRWSAAGVPQDLGGIAGVGRDNENQARAINDDGQVAECSVPQRGAGTDSVTSAVESSAVALLFVCLGLAPLMVRGGLGVRNHCR